MNSNQSQNPVFAFGSATPVAYGFPFSQQQQQHQEQRQQYQRHQAHGPERRRQQQMRNRQQHRQRSILPPRQVNLPGVISRPGPGRPAQGPGMNVYPHGYQQYVNFGSANQNTLRPPRVPDHGFIPQATVNYQRQYQQQPQYSTIPYVVPYPQGPGPNVNVTAITNGFQYQAVHPMATYPGYAPSLGSTRGRIHLPQPAPGVRDLWGGVPNSNVPYNSLRSIAPFSTPVLPTLFPVPGSAPIHVPAPDQVPVGAHLSLPNPMVPTSGDVPRSSVHPAFSLQDISSLDPGAPTTRTWITQGPSAFGVGGSKYPAPFPVPMAHVPVANASYKDESEQVAHHGSINNHSASNAHVPITAPGPRLPPVVQSLLDQVQVNQPPPDASADEDYYALDSEWDQIVPKWRTIDLAHEARQILQDQGPTPASMFLIARGSEHYTTTAETALVVRHLMSDLVPERAVPLQVALRTNALRMFCDYWMPSGPWNPSLRFPKPLPNTNSQAHRYLSPHGMNLAGLVGSLFSISNVLTPTDITGICLTLLVDGPIHFDRLCAMCVMVQHVDARICEPGSWSMWHVDEILKKLCQKVATTSAGTGDAGIDTDTPRYRWAPDDSSRNLVAIIVDSIDRWRATEKMKKCIRKVMEWDRKIKQVPPNQLLDPECPPSRSGSAVLTPDESTSKQEAP